MKFALVLLAVITFTTLSFAAPSQKYFLSKLTQRSSEKLLITVKQGQRQFKINCTPFCLKGKNRKFIVNCNHRLFQKLCAFCRISFRCGEINNVFF